jgi:hypothetical protein
VIEQVVHPPELQVTVLHVKLNTEVFDAIENSDSDEEASVGGIQQILGPFDFSEVAELENAVETL